MKKYSLILIIVSIFMLIFVSGCANSKLKKYTKYINNSMDSVSNIALLVEVKDENVLVYKYVRNIKFDGVNANIETIESTLSSSFILEDKVSNDFISDIDRDKINSINLSKNLLESFEVKSDVLKATINKDNISKVLGSNSLEILENAELTITFNKKQISKLECVFKTESGKDVVLNIEYNY